jgi:hypothetical protein
MDLAQDTDISDLELLMRCSYALHLTVSFNQTFTVHCCDGGKKMGSACASNTMNTEMNKKETVIYIVS